MRGLGLIASIVLVGAPLQASETKPVVVTPIFSSSVTASGQPIALPSKDVHVLVSMYDVAASSTLPEHKHLYPRYAYVLAGTIRVTNTETGKSEVYKSGDFIIEAIGQWHRAANVGGTPVKLLVVDQIEEAKDGGNNVVLRR